MSRSLKSTFFLLILSLSVFHIAHAQGIPGVGSPLALLLNPLNPQPGETVSMSLQSFSISLDQAYITWIVDGKVVAKGTGTKTASAVAGGLGSIKRVEARVSSPGNGDFSETASIRPARLSLLWQAATYAPPFYKGKALESFGAAYKIVAMPEIYGTSGRKIDPHALVYTWKKNDAVQADASGYGKSSFISSQSGFVRQGEDISVDVTSPADDFTVSAHIAMTPIVPEIHIYEKSPLYGTIYGNEISDRFDLRNEEITLSAEPYFFSANGKLSSVLGYMWTVNGLSVADPGSKDSLTLRKTAGSRGSSDVELSISNSARLLQGANKEIIIRYE
ncbi:hypothetical protein KW799_01525 [Candidatus Parcubacteria bacterium]|nr:hypothetical protein [Candidatus Parcubacteria bacterium]